MKNRLFGGYNYDIYSNFIFLSYLCGSSNYYKIITFVLLHFIGYDSYILLDKRKYLTLNLVLKDLTTLYSL